MLEQLPEETQNKLYTDFLYFEFLSTFRETFAIPKAVGSSKYILSKVFYTWEDQNYREFIMGVL